MATNFELQIAKFVEKAKGNVDLVVRRVSLDLFKRVIMKSPVDTGRFRANWQVAIESIPGGTLDATDKHGAATIARIMPDVLKMKAGETIYLVNNLSYARQLEYGWSKQAPAGMVRVTVQEYGAVVAGAVRS